MKQAAKYFIALIVGACIGFTIGYIDQPSPRRTVLMETALSRTTAGKTECSIDGVHWFPSRDDNMCYLQDAPGRTP